MAVFDKPPGIPPRDTSAKLRGHQGEAASSVFSSDAGETAISLEGDFAWNDSGPPSLKGIELHIPQGSLVAIVGATGSGKTSILSAALGLMKQTAGSPVQLRGKVSAPPCSRSTLGSRSLPNASLSLPLKPVGLIGTLATLAVTLNSAVAQAQNAPLDGNRDAGMIGLCCQKLQPVLILPA